MAGTETSEEPGRRVYLDTASGEALHPAAREVYAAALDAAYADPRRLHHAGRAARLVLDNARAATAEALGLRPDEVTFTSSGTAAVHRGLLGLHRGAGRHGDTLVHSAVEHSAVLEAATWTRSPTRSVPVDATARIDLDALDLEDATVVACQSANHEVGTLQPVADLAARLRRRTALRRRVRVGRPAPAPARVVGARRLGPQVGRAGRRRHPRRTAGRPLARALPGRRPRRRARERLRERAGRPRRGRGAPGRRRRARRRERPRSTPWSTGSGARSPTCPTWRSSATPTTGSPTW